MFDSLADRNKPAEETPARIDERVIRWAIAILVSGVLFGGLYLVVQHLD